LVVFLWPESPPSTDSRTKHYEFTDWGPFATVDAGPARKFLGLKILRQLSRSILERHHRRVQSLPLFLRFGPA
jgi:hypothetical protein